MGCSMSIYVVGINCFGNGVKMKHYNKCVRRFLKIAFVPEVGVHVCVSMCVRPQAINNYSHEIKSE